MTITLRTVSMDDAKALYEWRDADETRRFSLDSGPLVWESHERWLRQTLSRSDRHLLIGETATGPVGVVRFDLTEDVAEVSIYLVPGLSGRGLGTALLTAAMAWVKGALPRISHTRARVHPDNIGSQKMFSKAGFREVFREYEAPIKRPKAP